MENKTLIDELSKRLFEFIPPWDLDGYTQADAENDILNNPLEVIRYLLDCLE